MSNTYKYYKERFGTIWTKKRILGTVILWLPFVVLYTLIAGMEGFLAATGIFCFTGFLVGCVTIGVFLLN